MSFDFLDPSLTFWGNTLEQYLFSAGIFLGLIIIFRLTKILIIKRLELLHQKKEWEFTGQFLAVTRSVKLPIFVLFALLLALYSLHLSSAMNSFTHASLLVLLTIQALLTLGVFVDYLAGKYSKRVDSETEESAILLLTNLAKGALWVIGALLVLQNLGYNITSLVAGLGIGGIAIGFALQNILGDIFSSFAIILDKPFEPGDYIVVGKHAGTVEKVGIKTTRIRALQGEEIVISNQELTSARVQNFKKMQERRVGFTLGVSYQTTNSQLSKLLKQIEKIITKEEHTDFNRAHFHEFGESALIVNVVYHITSSNFTIYMDTHQDILLAIKAYCEKNKIEIAYPTQTVFLNQA